MSEKVHARLANRSAAAFIKTAAVLMLLTNSIPTVCAAGPANETALRNAWALYNAQRYRESSDAFEALIASSTPSARLYYYAALAMRACNRTARAKQLCQYIATTFPSAPEAAYANRLFPASGSSSHSSTAISTSGAEDEPVPASLKGMTAEQMLATEEGRNFIKRKAERQLAASSSFTSASPMREKTKGGRQGERVFTAADIAKDGANGIDQMYYPNCWFESSMSALAALPRGQRMMADMVRYGAKEGSYVVRFPGDGNEYQITEEQLEKTGIHDKALWATLIEAAQTLKYPNDNGGQLYEGLGSLTGHTAEYISPTSASDQELSLFIDGAVKSQNPIVCATYHYIPSGMPTIVVTGHAYSIIGFEPASGMVKIRNPHGINSRRFTLPNDPNHQKFEQLEDGVFKINIQLFKQYFQQVARSFI